MTADAVIARKTWRTLEPLHGVIYFAPEAAASYAALGLSSEAGYFASRSAAMGPVRAEAVIVHAATGEIAAAALQTTGGWSDDQWATAVESVRSRGWLADGPELHLSSSGSSNRQEVEDATDRLAVAPYATLGEEGCAELR